MKAKKPNKERASVSVLLHGKDIPKLHQRRLMPPPQSRTEFVSVARISPNLRNVRVYLPLYVLEHYFPEDKLYHKVQLTMIRTSSGRIIIEVVPLQGDVTEYTPHQSDTHRMKVYALLESEYLKDKEANK